MTTPEYAEFKRLAGIPDWVDKGAGTILWQHRPTEVLAETVRYFSGGIFMKEPFDIFQGLEPKQEAYDYVMSLMPERREIVKKEYIILHHSATKDGVLTLTLSGYLEVNGWRTLAHWVDALMVSLAIPAIRRPRTKLDATVFAWRSQKHRRIMSPSVCRRANVGPHPTKKLAAGHALLPGFFLTWKGAAIVDKSEASRGDG